MMASSQVKGEVVYIMIRFICTLPADPVKRIHFLVLFLIQGIMVVDLFWASASARWMHVFLILGLIATTGLPIAFPRRLPVPIPSEVQLLAIVFLFATLFLGEVREYYERIWWWDLMLHGSAGLLLGLLGFCVVYIFNENDIVDFRLPPAFVTLFAFFFSVGLGTLWEIFEFATDRGFDLTMQKPMLGDPSGLTDTMWDLILDTVGAAIISGAGWLYMRRGRRDWLQGPLRRFIEQHPDIFEPKATSSDR